jgi:hypothetical protein
METTNSSKFEDFKTTREYSDLMRKHSLNEYGFWTAGIGPDDGVLLEYIGMYEGTLENVIKAACEHEDWGYGAWICKTVGPTKV